MRGYSRDGPRLGALLRPTCPTPRPSSSSTTRTPFRSSSRIRSSATDSGSFRRGTARRRCGASRRSRSTSSCSTSCCPKLDGLEVCKRLRAESSVPIIMLTARDDELDKVLGPRARRGRLHHEAVLDPRVPEPRAGAAPARRRLAPRRAGGRGARRGQRSRSTWTGAPSTVDGAALDADVRRVRAPADARRAAGQGLQPPGAAPGDLGRLGVPRAADDRRPRAPSAREDRAGPERAELILTVRGAGYRFARAVKPFRTVGARLSLALLVVVAACSRSSTWSSSRRSRPARRLERRTRRPGVAVASRRPVWTSAERPARATWRRLRFGDEHARDDLRDRQPRRRCAARSSPTRRRRHRPRVENDPVAESRCETLAARRGVVTRGEQEYAEAARPSPTRTYVVLVSGSLEDSSRASPSSSGGC